MTKTTQARSATEAGAGGDAHSGGPDSLDQEVLPRGMREKYEAHVKGCEQCSASLALGALTGGGTFLPPELGGSSPVPACNEALDMLATELLGEPFSVSNVPQHIPDDCHVHRFSFEGRSFIHVKRMLGDGPAQSLFEFVRDEDEAVRIIDGVEAYAESRLARLKAKYAELKSARDAAAERRRRDNPPKYAAEAAR